MWNSVIGDTNICSPVMSEEQEASRLAIKEAVESLYQERYFAAGILFRHYLPPTPGQYRDFPQSCSERLVRVYQRRGLQRLYSHQSEAYEAVTAGKNTVIVTPTASGKTLCYNLPVIDTIIKDPETRALYIFPTKALAQDQLNELEELSSLLGSGIKVYTYDGDTPVDARRSVRRTANLVITNPDMLHTGILPHHPRWISLFENLKFVVIDEMHTYRGVFGSHMAHVIRRLKRIANYYGSRPVFIMCSATIANPLELASSLTDEEFVLISECGAPRGGRYFIFYNPPVVNEELGIRRSSLNEAQRLAEYFLDRGFKTIAFARSRLRVELLGRYLREREKKKAKGRNIRTYRGGYLPKERRDIEKGLRSGAIDGVVCTNAMELGVDIGELDVSIIAGYPGSIASTWQQAGRAGRRNREAVTVLVASSAPVDQYLVRHPRYFLEKSPEIGLINPDNFVIKAEHLKCASFELPVSQEEVASDPEAGEILDFLAENRFVHLIEGRYYWIGDAYPAHEVGLRSISPTNIVIMDITQPKPVVIGEMDRSSAMTMLYEGAIYLHQDEQYQVVQLDLDQGRAYVKRVKIDYYTDADLAVDIKVINVFAQEDKISSVKKWGEVLVTQMPTVYKKIRYRTHENIGYGQICLPQEDVHTSGFWLSIGTDLTREMSNEEKELALLGIANLYKNLSPVFLMCDSGDLGVAPQVKAVESGLPTVYVYDRYPGGIGLAEGLFRVNEAVVEAALETVRTCNCQAGCPSCIGPPVSAFRNIKEMVVKILRGCLG